MPEIQLMKPQLVSAQRGASIEMILDPPANRDVLCRPKATKLYYISEHSQLHHAVPCHV